ncbi:hypothetical protein ALC53_11022 [Atta colombica]|uniref:Uncharacterized protein n=1 Tax=Atta colombica TaxID=520822 RepID=A0A195B249_9HYME|nr:hypothetical protein ALC53_11022 [Atta colombica]
MHDRYHCMISFRLQAKAQSAVPPTRQFHHEHLQREQIAQHCDATFFRARETNLTALFNVFNGSDRGVSFGLFLIVFGILIYLIVWSEHHALPLQQSLAAARIVRSQNLSCKQAMKQEQYEIITRNVLIARVCSLALGSSRIAAGAAASWIGALVSRILVAEGGGAGATSG